MRYSLSKILLIFIMCSGFITMTSDTDIQKKIIRNGGYDIEFYVSLKNSNKLVPNKTYYWYKSGEIHSSKFSSGGLLLHADYMKFYRSNQLAEKGVFNYGLKDGTWKQWNANGELTSIHMWSKGTKHGKFHEFDTDGKMRLKGQYKRGEKSGPWVNLITKDTIFYEKGAEKIVDTASNKGFFNRLFKRKTEKPAKHKKVKKQKPKKNKDGFFKRLFKKKDKNKKT